MTVFANKPRTSAIIHVTANDTIVVAGNTTTSNIASDGEIVTGAHIKQVWCGSSSGNGAYWKVSSVNSAANSEVLLLVLDSTAYMDYAGNGVKVPVLGDELKFELVNGDEGYLMLELRKEVEIL